MYISKPVWSHVVVLSAWTLKKTHIVSCQEASSQITNICMQGSPHQLIFPFQTITDCIRYIICVFCYSFKSQMNILASY